MVLRSLWRWFLSVALILLLVLSLVGIWGGWQVRQAESVLSDLVEGRRNSAETQLVERAGRMALVGRWWPRAQWQRALLLEWSAQPLEGEEQRQRLEEADAVLASAKERLPALAFIARDQLRLAMKLGKSGGEIVTILERIDNRAPLNFELHRDALALLLPNAEEHSVPVQVWVMEELHRIAGDRVKSRALLLALGEGAARETACVWVGSDSELGRLCRQG